MKEFLHTVKDLNVLQGQSGALSLFYNDIAYQRLVVVISGVSKTMLNGGSSGISVNIKAGTAGVNLALSPDYVHEASVGTTYGCVVQIDFPIYFLNVTVTAPNENVSISIYGGNS